MKIVGKVERIAAPTVEQFHRDYVLPSRPAIITGSIKDWKALQWTPEYLKSVMGQNRVRATRQPAGYFSGDPDAYVQAMGDFAFEDLPFGEFLDSLYAERPEGAVPAGHYIRGGSISGDFKALAGDLGAPTWLETKVVSFGGLWIGAKGTFSPLHYDLCQSLFVQLQGNKRVLAIRPEETPNLYPLPVVFRRQASRLSNWPGYSRVNVYKPALDRYPRYTRATALEAVLEPGDVLFMPFCWWHWAENVTASMSVHFNARPPLRHVLSPSPLWMSLRTVPYMAQDMLASDFISKR